MKKISFVLSMLALVLVFGLALVGCENGTTGDDGSEIPGDATGSVTLAKAVSKPGQPSNFKATTKSESQITLSWKKPSSGGAPTGYNIYRALTPNQWSIMPHKSVSGGTTSWTDTGLAGNKSYYYKVSAYNSAGESALTTSQTAITKAGKVPVSKAKGITAITMMANEAGLTISWDKFTNASTYNLFRANTKNSGTFIKIKENIAATSYSDTSISGGLKTPGTSFYYKIEALDSEGTPIEASEAKGILVPKVAIYGRKPSGSANGKGFIKITSENGNNTFSTKSTTFVKGNADTPKYEVLPGKYRIYTVNSAKDIKQAQYGDWKDRGIFEFRTFYEYMFDLSTGKVTQTKVPPKLLK